MNVIKVYLKESGSIADIDRSFEIIQNSWGNILLNVIVPKLILADRVTSPETKIRSAVRVSGIGQTPDGNEYATDSFGLRYRKKFTVEGKDFELHELDRRLFFPFVRYPGQMELDFEVVRFLKDNNGIEIEEIVTTQRCSFPVRPGKPQTSVQPPEFNELDGIWGELNATEQDLEGIVGYKGKNVTIYAPEGDKINLSTLKDEVETKLPSVGMNKYLVTGLRLTLWSPSPEIMILEQTLYNPVTGETITNMNQQLTAASLTKGGLMSSGAYKDLYDTKQKLADESARAKEAENSLSERISAQEGLGGYLQMHNFGTSVPTQQQLTDYAISQIANITNPLDIFNGTRVQNTFDNTIWVLTNTLNTTPPIFIWEAAMSGGSGTVGQFTNNIPGIIKGSTELGAVAANPDGTGLVNGWDGVDDHIKDTSTNPHNVTAEQIGLENVDNTADIDKPLSKAVSQAIASFPLYSTTGDGSSYIIADTKIGTPVIGSSFIVIPHITSSSIAATLTVNGVTGTFRYRNLSANFTASNYTSQLPVSTAISAGVPISVILIPGLSDSYYWLIDRTSGSSNNNILPASAGGTGSNSRINQPANANISAYRIVGSTDGTGINANISIDGDLATELSGDTGRIPTSDKVKRYVDSKSGNVGNYFVHNIVISGWDVGQTNNSRNVIRFILINKSSAPMNFIDVATQLYDANLNAGTANNQYNRKTATGFMATGNAGYITGISGDRADLINSAFYPTLSFSGNMTNGSEIAKSIRSIDFDGTISDYVEGF